MKKRRVLLILLLVGGFWFVTEHLPSSLGRLSLGNLSLFHAGGSGSPLDLTQAQAAPAFDAEELNNIAIYEVAGL
jgi:hypothetical protein